MCLDLSLIKSYLQGPGLTFVVQMIGVAFFLVFGLFLLIHSTDDLTDIRNSDLKASKIHDLVSDSRITCRRRPLLSATWYPYEREYHAFDNVLLMVFFSHARYDVNLESYREVYSEFFPNVRILARIPGSSPIPIG